MTVDGPQAGGVVAVYSLPTNIGMFDMTAALDPDLSDGARGLLWRILALNERHVRLYGETNPFRIWQKELVGGAPGGLLAVRGYLRELATCGYVRRWKEQDEQGQFRWVTEAAAVRAFDGDNLREEIAVVDVTDRADVDMRLVPLELLLGHWLLLCLSASVGVSKPLSGRTSES